MPKPKVKNPRRKAKASNKRMLHDMVMKRLGRYVENNEETRLKKLR